MSKHSKWSKVKHYKGTADAKRAAVFTKLARAITVAAREGGGDVNFNFKLRSAIDQALEGNMPKENIDRAVKKGTGEIASDRIEEVLYEGFGPSGVAVLIEALTDNRNRTSANIKHILSTNGGNLAASGAVRWMFERKGVVALKSGGHMDDAAEFALIDAGADDISTDNDGGFRVSCLPEELAKVREAASQRGFTISSAGFEWTAKEDTPEPDADMKEKIESLFEALDDDEDVNAIYSNT